MQYTFVVWCVFINILYNYSHSSEHSPDEATPTPHPLGATVCPTGFLEVLSYSLEGEVPSEAVNDEEDDLPSFADFKQKMSNQGAHFTICIIVQPCGRFNLLCYIIQWNPS